MPSNPTSAESLDNKRVPSAQSADHRRRQSRTRTPGRHRALLCRQCRSRRTGQRSVARVRKLAECVGADENVVRPRVEQECVRTVPAQSRLPMWNQPPPPQRAADRVRTVRRTERDVRSSRARSGLTSKRNIKMAAHRCRDVIPQVGIQPRGAEQSRAVRCRQPVHDAWCRMSLAGRNRSCEKPEFACAPAKSATAP